jgi:hypothetical protein
MIAMPFHPSNAYTIDELNANLTDILAQTEKRAAEVAQGRAPYTLLDKVKGGRLQVQQGIIAGCAGGTLFAAFSRTNAPPQLWIGKTVHDLPVSNGYVTALAVELIKK